MNILRKNRKITLLAIALVITVCGTALFNSCSKEFLEPVPLNFYEPTVTLSTESGMRAVMAMADRHLRNYWTHHEDNPGHNSNPMGTEYMFSDLMAYGKTDEGNTQVNFLAANLTPSNAGSGVNNDGTSGNSNGNVIQYFWVEGYNGMKYANTVINFIDQVQGMDETTKNAYLGRALFHRAMRYYTLVFQFGDVPLITKIPSAPKFNYRSTKKEAILDMITLDLEKAVDLVPDQKDMAYKGMVNKGACRMLLAKCYLATGQFEKAKTQLDILIDQSGYSLVQGELGEELIKGGESETWPITRNVIWDLHRSQNKMIADNTEAIMVMPNRGFQNASFRQWLQMRIYGAYWDTGNIRTPDGQTAIQPIARSNLSNYNQQLDFTRAVGRGIGVFRPTGFAQYGLWAVNGVMDDKDLRHSGSVEKGGVGNWVNMTDLKVNNRASEYYGQNLVLYHPETGALLCADTVRSWYNWPHYKHWNLHVPAEADKNATAFNGAVSGSTEAHGDIYLYRLAEAYLLRAEAKFYLEDIAGATADVNAVRERARCAQKYSTVNIGDIMNERARELYMEEWRNVELKRVSRCLALSGKPDEWGNTYDVNTYDKQDGKETTGGSYWWQRICHYNNFYNKGNIVSNSRDQEYTLDKHNMYWPIREQVIDSNREGELAQAFGYAGYNVNTPKWETWQEAVEDEDKAN